MEIPAIQSNQIKLSNQTLLFQQQQHIFSAITTFVFS